MVSLPPGYEYHLHDEASAPKFYAEKVWGVSIYNFAIDGGGPLGHVQKNMSAHTVCDEKYASTVRLLLNRVAAALWHHQPNW